MEFLAGEENLLYPSSEHTRPQLPSLFARMYSGHILFEKLTFDSKFKVFARARCVTRRVKFQLQGRR
jgi:hypothetical protein